MPLFLSSFLFPLFSLPLRAISNKMTREQKVGDALAHGVLVAAAGADELALDHLGLEQEAVQVAQRLGVCAQVLWRRRRGGESWEAELF